MWERIKKFVKRSETIAWAWANMLVGGGATLLTYVDPALIEPLLTPQVFAFYVLLNGIATKWLRERRDPELRKEEDSEFTGGNV